MGLFGWGQKKTVRLTMADIATGETFAQSDVPPESLPESFALATTMHIQDVPWTVVSATPPSRNEAARIGRLHVVLQRLEMVDPKTLLFSLPSISDELPAIGEEPAGPQELVLREDDWRQLEFVSATLAPAIERELIAIRAVLTEKRVGIGFGEIHVRREVPRPLIVPVALAALGPDVAAVTQVRFDGNPLGVVGGFALKVSPALSLYGVTEGGGGRDGERAATVLAVQPTGNARPHPEDVERLRRLARAHELTLIDWCSATQQPPDGEKFGALIGAR